jgi:hypothetical protein
MKGRNYKYLICIIIQELGDFPAEIRDILDGRKPWSGMLAWSGGPAF